MCASTLQIRMGIKEESWNTSVLTCRHWQRTALQGDPEIPQWGKAPRRTGASHFHASRPPFSRFRTGSQACQLTAPPSSGKRRSWKPRGCK